MMEQDEYRELKTPEKWVGVRSRGGKRYWSEISSIFVNEDGQEIKEHNNLGYYNSPHEAAIVRDALVIEKNIPNEKLNFPHLEPRRIIQLANQSKEKRLRANERMTLGTGTDTQTLNDLVETFKEESNSDVPLLERVLVDVPIPPKIREQQYFSGPHKQYRYFIWGADDEFYLDRYEEDSENVWIRRWDSPRVFTTEKEARDEMKMMMEQDDKEPTDDE